MYADAAVVFVFSEREAFAVNPETHTPITATQFPPTSWFTRQPMSIIGIQVHLVSEFNGTATKLLSFIHRTVLGVVVWQ